MRQGINLNRIRFDILDRKGNFLVDDGYKAKVIHEEFDNGKIYDDRFIENNSFEIKEKIFKKLNQKSLPERLNDFLNRFRNIKRLNPGEPNFDRKTRAPQPTNFDRRYRVESDRLRPMSQQRRTNNTHRQVNDRNSPGSDYRGR